MKDKQPKKIAVVATAEGFFGGSRRRKGSIFFVPEGKTGKWFEPTDPTLAAVNASALEEASKAKLKAQEKARAEILEAEQKAKDVRARVITDVQVAGRVADEQARKKIFGGLYSKPKETEEYKANVEADKANASNEGDTDGVA
jgi:hypothetical protein